MTRPRYPLFAEADRSPLLPDGSAVAYDATARGLVKAINGRANEKLRTVGDLFRFTQGIIAEGFNQNPRPSTDDIIKNEVLLNMGVISSEANAEAFGFPLDTDPRERLARDSSVLHHWHHHRWMMNGRYLYDLTPEVVQAFMDTDVAVLTSDITLAESTCYLAMPASSGFTVWHPQSGTHVLDGFYVTVSENAVLVVAVGMPHPGRPSYDNALTSFVIRRADFAQFTDWLGRQEKDPMSMRVLGANAEHVPTWMQIIVNALLYINNVSEDVKHDPDFGVPPSAHERAKRISGRRVREKYLDGFRHRCRYHVLGGLVAKATKAPVAAGESLPLRSRFIVRGHWRRQPHGPANSLRKLAWIQPHWKGPEDAPVVPTTNIVRVD